MRAKPKKARALHQGFLLRLQRFRVLDPACGSGNFLYLALAALRDVEKRVHVDAQELGLGAELVMHTGPHNILGLEINDFAAELARVTVWIGDIQWCRRNGYQHAVNPILKPLDGIEHRDALLNPDCSEAEWPAADVITGNPPFVGDKLMRARLGAAYVEALRQCFEGRVPGGADFVTYWFEKARAQIAAGETQVVGLVATDSIRGGANRKVLERIVETTRIFEAWSSEHWVNEGAAVRVSLIGFGPFFGVDRSSRLDGVEVAAIHADLTAAEGLNLTQARKLTGNLGISFQGAVLIGPFEVEFSIAHQWFQSPNPHGISNSQVIRPITNGKDITSRSRGLWVIDFGPIPEAQAALFELPFGYTAKNVKPIRATNPRPKRRDRWWVHGETGAGWRQATESIGRYIATSQVSKHRFFVWQSVKVWPHQTVISIARADDATFGILHSRFHELWSLRLGTALEDRPRYTPTTCFETFPFPAGLTPRDTAPIAGQASPPCLAGQIVAENIAAAARRLNELRETWLNPAERVDWVITPEEEKAGFPKRPVAKPGHEADLKKRTLTNLYNARPAWLALAHKALDQAVAAAYGWADYTPEMPDDEILRRLLALNLERSQGGHVN
jgi:type II restriction/modification system DNA methylase subunit YeeA